MNFVAGDAGHVLVCVPHCFQALFWALVLLILVVYVFGVPGCGRVVLAASDGFCFSCQVVFCKRYGLVLIPQCHNSQVRCYLRKLLMTQTFVYRSL